MAMELHEVFCYPVDPVKPRQDATVIHEYPFGNVQNQMHPNDAEDDQCSDSFERMYTKTFMTGQVKMAKIAVWPHI